MLDLSRRPRRTRKSQILRNLVHETDLPRDCLIQPYFLNKDPQGIVPITGFTDVNSLGIEPLSRRVEMDVENGIRTFLLFAGAEDAEKNPTGSSAVQSSAIVPDVVAALKRRFGESAAIITDVCLCPYTDHGHCGVVEGGVVQNDPSLSILQEMALVHAQAGADLVAPSDMMDGRVGAIRQKLDESGYSSVGILAYTAKYASNYYGPFRGALGSAPKGMDRSTYQMDFRNVAEAIYELRLDEAEGADIVMVKPALAYLDVIQRVRQSSSLPVAAYSVSGEYEMVKQLARAGLADERALALENLMAIRRAGANVIITYFASQIGEKDWLQR